LALLLLLLLFKSMDISSPAALVSKVVAPSVVLAAVNPD
jgi:hypothetical protein